MWQSSRHHPPGPCRQVSRNAVAQGRCLIMLQKLPAPLILLDVVSVQFLLGPNDSCRKGTTTKRDVITHWTPSNNAISAITPPQTNTHHVPLHQILAAPHPHLLLRLHPRRSQIPQSRPPLERRPRRHPLPTSTPSPRALPPSTRPPAPSTASKQHPPAPAPHPRRTLRRKDHPPQPRKAPLPPLLFQPPNANRTTQLPSTLQINNTTYTLLLTSLPLSHPLPIDLSPALAASDAALLLYSVRDAASLAPLLSSAQLRAHATRKGYPMILVGTQADAGDGEREVVWAAGARAAGAMGVGEFVEVSGRTGEGVERVVGVLGEEVARVLKGGGKGEEERARGGGRGRRGLWRIFGRGRGRGGQGRVEVRVG